MDADLLELSRTVERCVPADAETARECLQSLNDALCGQHQRSPDESIQRPVVHADHAQRMCSLIARIAHDLDGGHVLAISGLERQMKHYLQESTRGESRVCS